MTQTTSTGAAAAFRFSTKAETLENLKGRLRSGHLCDQMIIRYRPWSDDADTLLAEALERFGDQSLIVRSSAASEDSWDNSMAGAHLSLADVAPDTDALRGAIASVFESYRTRNPADQVLVQPMVQKVAISGVVLTRDLDTGSPYYVVNYDDFSGRTDTVTGGRESTTMLIRRAAPHSLKSPRIRKLIDCILELEAITGAHELDIEFCITGADEVFIFQVRPLSARGMWSALADSDVDRCVAEISERLGEYMSPRDGLAGQSTIFTEMTDWNPAEMIGNTPRPLALSLYKSLITDGIWADARREMGYRMVDGPLLIDFHGRPFIDVRKSFNSFLPAGLPEIAAAKLVDHQLSRLAANRELHDKVEFEICVTCWDFSEEKALARLRDAGLDADEIETVRGTLQHLTRNVIANGADGLERLLDQANRLLESPAPDGSEAPRASLRRQIEDCRRLGTLTFSQLARHGFIGVQFLKSLVEQGALTGDEMEAFMHSISTVATALAEDLSAVSRGEFERTAFLERYGHLRPGTYDILSWRYDERPDLYLSHGSKPASGIVHKPFELGDATRVRIEKLLHGAGYDFSAEHLLAYISAAIKGREAAKFAFTKTVSNILSLIAAWGESAGLTRDDVSFLEIGTLLDGNPDRFGEMIARARDDYTLTRAIRLPHVILSPDDVDVVRMPLGQPTFITSKAVTARTVHLTSVEAPDIDDRIVLIESADPGFDWIFSHDIRGLITKYGGANSHMAIRCAEFGLPAAIGCGERLFDNLTKASFVELNAAAKKLSSH